MCARWSRSGSRLSPRSARLTCPSPLLREVFEDVATARANDHHSAGRTGVVVRQRHGTLLPARPERERSFELLPVATEPVLVREPDDATELRAPLLRHAGALEVGDDGGADGLKRLGEPADRFLRDARILRVEFRLGRLESRRPRRLFTCAAKRSPSRRNGSMVVAKARGWNRTSPPAMRFPSASRITTFSSALASTCFPSTTA